MLTESNITLNFPDNNYFRFQDCEGYKQIQHNLKEMDTCWFNNEDNILYLIELKNWENNSLIEENDFSISKEEISLMKSNISKSRINNLLKKSIDSVSIFMSILLDKPQGLKIQKCSPFTINNNTTIKLISIINWTSSDITYIANINTEYKTKFKSYAKLYSISAYLVMTKEQAAKQFNWIT